MQAQTRVLVIRREDHVELRELSAAECALLGHSCAARHSAKRSNTPPQADATADLGLVLGRVVKLQTLVDFEIH